MSTIASARAYQLQDAIMQMTRRYGEAQAKHAYKFSEHVWSTRPDTKAAAEVEAERWSRAIARRHRALQRLTRCLRDLER